MPDADPLSLERLLAYAAGEASVTEAAAIEAALDESEDAAAVVRLYRWAALATRSDQAPAPPPEQIARAKARFGAEFEARPRNPWWQAASARIAACLFDSRTQPLGLRYSNAGQRLQWAHGTADWEIDTRAERLDDGTWRVEGQCMGPDEASATAVVALGPQTHPAREVSTDDRGRFSIVLPPGPFDLLIQIAPDECIRIPELELPDD